MKPPKSQRVFFFVLASGTDFTVVQEGGVEPLVSVNQFAGLNHGGILI